MTNGRLRVALVVVAATTSLALAGIAAAQTPDDCTSAAWDLSLAAEQRVAVDGYPVDYVITVGNAGRGACDVTGAAVTIALPDGSTLTLDSDVDFRAGAEPVTYMARYAADEQAHAVAGAVVATASATGELQTADPQELTVEADLELPFAHPGVGIDAGPDLAVAAGSDAQLEVTVRNTGDVDLEEVAVDDSAFDVCDVAVGGLAVGESQTFGCTVAAVESGAVRTVTVRALAVGNLAALVEATDDGEVTVLGAAGAGTAIVGDRAWFDTDGDGAQDLGEPGAAGIDVRLLTPAGDEVAAAVTGDGGLYLFRDVPAGDYLLAFTLTDSLIPVAQGRGGAEADSDIGADGRTGVFTLAAGADDRSRDAGFAAGDVEILPATGLDAGVLAVAALLLMLAGAGVLAATRRRS